MDKQSIQDKLSDLGLKEWVYNETSKSIEKSFAFKSYLKTISFVNAIAWIANRDNHHPDLMVSFGRCHVSLTTHDAGGISEKDFSLAKAIDSL